MKSLYFTFSFCLIILPLIALRDRLACLPCALLYRHMLYMFAHASVIHWLCNTWSLLVFHNLFRPSRLIAAYGLSVLVSFLPLSKLPVLGMSVIVCFFLGLAARYSYRTNPIGMFLSLALLVGSCFLPGFAGLYHIAMFALGFLYLPVECFFKRISNYINE